MASPTPSRLDETTISADLLTALKQAVEDSHSPGAVGCVGNLETLYLCEAVGNRQLTPVVLPASRDTLYDLASLTKVVATTTAVLLLRDDGVVDLDAPVSDYVPLPSFGRFTVRQLLTHTSGLNAGKPYYKEVKSLEEVLSRYAKLELEDPPGARWRYSDAGFMILGKLVELASRDAFDAFCRKRIFSPLGMTRTAFNPSADLIRDCAATELCEWRGRVMVGQVHDENAYAVGGVSGHAGLFSTAGDLARFCRGLLSGEVLKASTLDEMTRLGQVAVNPWQGLGWWLDSWTTDATSGACRGFLPSRAAMGHTGWTGTSLWMDRASGTFAILLGNTCHPSRAARLNDPFRRTFHVAVARDLYPAKRAVHSGLDRLAYEKFELLRGMRIALLTHHAAVDQFNRHAIDVLKAAPGVDLRVVYSPEHGLRGTEEAGAKISGQSGPVRIVSLYGERTEPLPEELAQIDTLVVDLQDVGSRYYTYPATMKACMAACAKAGKIVTVLDRPNPVGGAVLEGPLAAKTDANVCWGAVPVRHGMTMGELAMHFRDNELAGLGVNLQISELDGWSRELLFSECSLPWVAPSPNIPTPETAVLYTGMCLFEGTNLNEGRGTDTPFHVVGAPWLKAKAIDKILNPDDFPGCRWETVEYTPRSIPGKSTTPVFLDTKCTGLRIVVENIHEARPFTSAIALLCAIREKHPEQLELKPFLDVLTGSEDLRRRIEAGASARSIVESYAPGLAAFASARPQRYV